MVTAPDDVKQVLFGDQGVVKGSKKGLTVIDMSTIGPSAAKEIASTLANHDIEFLDAPVTGSTPGAINGTLTIFVGGNEEVFNQFKPVLEVLGTNIQYMGGIGMGQAIKLINNHLIAASVVALAEGMILADTMGLSRRKAAETLQTVPAMSAFMNLKIPNYVRNEFPLLFSAINMKKDLSLANGEAQKNNKKLPILSQVEKMYEELLKDHFEKEDMSIIIKLLENFK
jgi:3-hydroxyisobutyrate dehydrogenase